MPLKCGWSLKFPFKNLLNVAIFNILMNVKTTQGWFYYRPDQTSNVNWGLGIIYKALLLMGTMPQDL